MEFSTITGLLLGVVILAAAAASGRAPVSLFLDPSALLCVCGGTLCTLLIGYPVRTLRLLPAAVVKSLFRSPATDHQRLIEQIVALAESARRNGLLSLERQVETISHPLLKLALQLAIDGTRPAVLQDRIRCEIERIAANQRACQGMLEQLGKFAPAFGMIGTVLGLVMMLNNMSDPSTIGRGMAVALLTTLYGAVLANLFFLPMAQKLEYCHSEEMKALELVARGVLAIQAGENPRGIARKLASSHPPLSSPAQQAA